MSAERVLARLRRFLLALSGALLSGVLLELWMIEHTEDPVQLIPFALGGLGLLALGGAWLQPPRTTFLALRASMALVALVAVGGLFGMYKHIESNVAFQLEIQTMPEPSEARRGIAWPNSRNGVSRPRPGAAHPLPG